MTEILKISRGYLNLRFGAGGGIRTHEPLRDRVLSPAPLTWLGNPRLEGGVRKLSDKAVCRRLILGPGFSWVFRGAISPALPSLALEGSGAGRFFLEFLCAFLSLSVSSPSLAFVCPSVAG